MNPQNFENLILELIEENPFAVRTVLKILRVEYTHTIPTLCVTMEEKPRMLVNLDFVNANCRNEKEVKALICHEFLHVVLRHTEKKTTLSAAEHLAMDAVINAIIHRELGPEYSSMMSHYYSKARGLLKMLRPISINEITGSGQASQWKSAWEGLYDGKLVVDDIKELAEDLCSRQNLSIELVLSNVLGNHDDTGVPLPQSLEEALDRTLKAMNGSGIWRSPGSRGIGSNPYKALFTEENIAMEKWKQSTMAVLKKYVSQKTSGKASSSEEKNFRIPVLNSQDRRAYIRSLWSPFLPEVEWTSTYQHPRKQTQIYLDVSGSMDAEMPYLIALLNKLNQYICKPFWAFSTVVATAVIEGGQLTTTSSGGTSLQCVLDHIAQTRPDCAVIVTDGYIEEIDPAEMIKVRNTRLHALISRDGNPEKISRAGIDYTQLERIPG